MAHVRFFRPHRPNMKVGMFVPDDLLAVVHHDLSPAYSKHPANPGNIVNANKCPPRCFWIVWGGAGKAAAI